MKPFYYCLTTAFIFTTVLYNALQIGLCAMDKKAKSKPMKEIVSRLLRNGEFEIVTFGDAVLRDKEVCDLI